jgi:hypothetical protein
MGVFVPTWNGLHIKFYPYYCYLMFWYTSKSFIFDYAD